jgi:uncharacterized membrane protein
MTEKNTEQSRDEQRRSITDTGRLVLEREYQDEKRSQRRLRRFRRAANEALSENQSLLPWVGSVIGVLLALLLGRAGADPDPDTWTITVDAARNGLLSVLSILFAGLSIVLGLASVTIQNVVGRFSLRLLRIYLRNPLDKAVIAVFAMAATFILAEFFQLSSLPSDALAPVGSVVIGALLLFFSGAMMIWYLGALSSWFRVDRTVRRVARVTLHAARSLERGHREDSPAAESSFQRPAEAISVIAHRSGYLTDVDTLGLYDLAVRYDTNFVIDRGVGLSVVAGEPIGWTAGTKSAPDGLPPDRVADTIEITDVRSLGRAVGYGIFVLVDMAIMALSPGVNDPNTAVQVIEEMMFLFPQLAQVRSGPVGRTDAEGRQRVAVRAFSLGDYIEMATTQIVLYAGEDPAVIRALQHFVRVLKGLELNERDQEAVDNFASGVRGLAGEKKGNHGA